MSEEIKDIAEYEVNDSELAKYTISKLHEENKQLKRMLNIKEKLDKKEIPYEWDFKDMFDMRKENTLLQQQLKDKDEKISKAIDHINETGMICACGQDSYEKLQNDILEILESNKED